MEKVLIKNISAREDIEKAMAFITKIALEKHGASPPPLPEILLAAYSDEKIIGTIGMDFGSEDKLLPIESHWLFDTTTTPLPFLRNKIVEIGRWMAVKPIVSSCLFYAATTLALSHKKLYCLAEMKSKIAQHSTRLGFIMLPIKETTLVPDNIPNDGLPYYLDEPPSLYMLVVEQMHQIIRQNSPSLKNVEFTF